MGSCSLLQGFFPTQDSDPGLLPCRQILYQLSHHQILVLPCSGGRWGPGEEARLNWMFWLELKSQASRPPESSFFLSEQRRGRPRVLALRTSHWAWGRGRCPRQWGSHLGLRVCVFNHSVVAGSLWTVTHQAPLFVGFSRQEDCSGSPFPLQGVFPTQGLGPHLLCLWQWQPGSLPLSPLGRSPRPDHWAQSRLLLSAPRAQCWPPSALGDNGGGLLSVGPSWKWRTCRGALPWTLSLCGCAPHLLKAENFPAVP